MMSIISDVIDMNRGVLHLLTTAMTAQIQMSIDYNFQIPPYDVGNNYKSNRQSNQWRHGR